MKFLHLAVTLAVSISVDCRFQFEPGSQNSIQGTIETDMAAMGVGLNAKLEDLSVGQVCCGCKGGLIIGKQCMVFSEDKLSWSDAALRCGRNGGSLVSIIEPNLVLAYVILYYNSEHFWVGASDIAKEGSWIWLDEHPVTLPFPWATGQPDNAGGEHCMSVPYKEGFNDAPCELELNYICEIGYPFPDPSTYRADNRCGSSYLAPNGKPGICSGVYSCCSNVGWCGNSPAHCDCPGCIDYRGTSDVQRRRVLNQTLLNTYDRVNGSDSGLPGQDLLFDHKSQITEAKSSSSRRDNGEAVEVEEVEDELAKKDVGQVMEEELEMKNKDQVTPAISVEPTIHTVTPE